MKQTTLHDEHIKLNAKMVEFGGWHMPVSYSSIIEEHKAVRNSVGIFDVSHMGQIFVSGDDALNFLQKILPQDVSKFSENHAHYCQLTYPSGGMVDDLIVYRLKDKYLIIANASRIEADFEWFEMNKPGFNINLENKSDEYSMIALQGPNAYKIIEKDGLTCLQDCKGYVFEPKMLIESVSNSKDAIKDTGYTAAQMNIITKDGVQEELQYRGTGTDKLAELEHVPYDIKKNKDSVQRPEYDFLRSIFGKYKNDDDFDKLYNQYLSDTYKTTRRAELGFFGTVPDISDYLGDKLTPDELDAISFEGLRKLHNYTKKLVDKQNAA